MINPKPLDLPYDRPLQLPGGVFVQHFPGTESTDLVVFQENHPNLVYELGDVDLYYHCADGDNSLLVASDPVTGLDRLFCNGYELKRDACEIGIWRAEDTPFGYLILVHWLQGADYLGEQLFVGSDLRSNLYSFIASPILFQEGVLAFYVRTWNEKAQLICAGDPFGSALNLRTLTAEYHDQRRRQLESAITQHLAF